MVRQLFGSGFALPRGLVSFVSCSVLILACSKERASSSDEKAEPDTKAARSESAKPAATSGISEKPNAKDARKLTEALPPPDRVQKIVNPKKMSAYSGETGGIRGLVVATGDSPPKMDDAIEKMDSNCTTSRDTFGVLFREGKNRELADVLVAVTGYEGFVPAKGSRVELKAEGCAWEYRTVALTFGQSLSIKGVDNRPYVPEFLEQKMPAQLFVLPTAPEVQLPPQRPGRFTLVDSMRLFNVAQVFALPYATVDVSDTQGAFEVQGIPVGEVSVNAMLPQTGVVTKQKVTIKAGEVTELKFEIPFSQADYDKMEKPKPIEQLGGPSKIKPPTP